MLIYDSKANRIKIKFKKISNLIPDSCFVKQCLLPLRYWYYANSISVNTLILLACYKSDGKQNNEIKAQATRTVIIIFCVLFIAHFSSRYSSVSGKHFRARNFPIRIEATFASIEKITQNTN